jgi:hypothetical protein
MCSTFIPIGYMYGCTVAGFPETELDNIREQSNGAVKLI